MSQHPSTYKLVRVSLADRSYNVQIGAGLLRSLGERVRAATLGNQTGETPVAPTPIKPGQTSGPQTNLSRAFVVIDDNLPDAFTRPALQSLADAGFDVTAERITALETTKTLDTFQRLLDSLARSRHERLDPVLAIGGGITGDIAGFVASAYRRGVPVIQCPTTLLAMVDASVGGKTGVNGRVGDSLLKNMIGAFWQPRLVIADIAALESLDDRQFRCGLAECLKHGLLSCDLDTDLFDWTTDCLERFHCRDEQALIELVARNVALKARIVERDERERAVGPASRILLNLGHTFAHAIETIPHLSPDNDPACAPLLHGEAVALGLVACGACAVHLGRIDRAALDWLTKAIARAGLPVSVANLPADDEILASMGHDKKVAGGKLRFVLPAGPGRATVVDDVPVEAIKAGLDSIRTPV